MSSTAMLVDGQNLLMRSIFAAAKSGMSSGSVDTGPLVLFVNGLAKHIAIEQPERLVVVWDGGTSQARRDRLPGYKGDRRPVPEEIQIQRDQTFDLVRRFCALAGIYTLQMTGYEADDLIAGAWHRMRDVEQIVILSADKDFLQLVGPNPHGIPTELVRLSSGSGVSRAETDRWDEERLIRELGHTPAQWPLMTALTGDKGDGVPGLRGVGPVKARKLLEAGSWDLNVVTADMDEVDRLLVLACFYCVDLRTITMPVVVPRWRPTSQDSQLWTKLIYFLDSFDLKGISHRVQLGELWSERDLISAPEGDEAAVRGAR